ncbi:hypothetical protein G7085_19185 [Tessaracoccus sp. HDW20]|uniref:hypothetical protein n=1 Tax=Tessaracoccus coleopterorum TaxID=2714950 RepID=UPI0018D45046|nr:hypothetical protein [Tessaracoccus coleopterorum]NHB85951.1 hypothetical protein [Tessaracoccus coleopterorum]
MLVEADEGTEAVQIAKLKEAARLLADDAAADWLFLLPNLIISTPRSPVSRPTRSACPST